MGAEPYASRKSECIQLVVSVIVGWLMLSVSNSCKQP